jgi:hypothetical protein
MPKVSGTKAASDQRRASFAQTRSIRPSIMPAAASAKTKE